MTVGWLLRHAAWARPQGPVMAEFGGKVPESEAWSVPTRDIVHIKLQALVYDILPSTLEEGAGKRCSECESILDFLCRFYLRTSPADG